MKKYVLYIACIETIPIPMSVAINSFLGNGLLFNIGNKQYNTKYRKQQNCSEGKDKKT